MLIVKSPLLAPVNVPVPTVNLFALSSNPINALLSSPRSMIIPASPEAGPVAPLASSISWSVITLFVVAIVVVAPLTVRSPETITF